MSYSRPASSHPFPSNQVSGQATIDRAVRSRADAADDPPPRPHSNHLQTPEAAFINRHRSTSKKAIWLVVGAIALSLLAIIPAQVGSKSIDTASCEKKVLPTGQISRGQISSLLALPTGSNKVAVRQVVGEPYCLLPAVDAETAAASADKILASAEREAYPLAFDPDAWVVLDYSNTGEYTGYDFVFK